MFSNLFTCFRALPSRRPQLAAIGYLLISTTAFSAMNVGIHMVSAHLHPTLIVMLRTLITLALLTPWLLYRRTPSLRTPRLRQHLTRGVVGGCGMIGWTYSVSIMPVTHATALSFTAPLFVTLLAVLFLREKAGVARWLALGMGFLGTLIILRPDASGFDSGAIIVLLTSLLWAITGILIKSLSATEPPLRVVFYMNAVMLFLALPFGLYHWVTPDPASLGLLVFIALCSLVMHLSMVRAYSLAPLVTLMPFDFTRLLSTALFAYFIFGETSDWMTWLGAAIIVGSAVAGARRDARAPVVS